MQEKLLSLNNTNICIPVEPPKSGIVFPRNGFLKLKLKLMKALRKQGPLCSQSFKQIEGIDFFETFVPTSKPETDRFFPSLAAKKN